MNLLPRLARRFSRFRGAFDCTSRASLEALCLRYDVAVPKNGGNGDAALDLLGTIIHRPWLRWLYPRPLSNRRFVGELAADPPGDVVKWVYACRPDLREAFPLGLTPAGREGFAHWLFGHGRPDLGLTDAEILWHLVASADDPSHGLELTWLMSCEWQTTHPNAMTKNGWSAFKAAVAKKFHLNAPWLATARRPNNFFLPSLLGRGGGGSNAEPSPNPSLRGRGEEPFGVNILGHFRLSSGLQEEALQYAAAIRAHGGEVSLRDAPLGFRRCPADGRDYLGLERFDITLAKLGACESLDEQYPLVGWPARPGVYRIACWSWELETLPPHVAGKADLADEIWTPSEFCARALRATFPAKTVTTMMPGVSLPKIAPRSRSYFGLPEDRFLIFFAFDIGSVMERKNPLGLIDAFRRAFRADDHAHLAIKVSHGDSRPANLARLKQACREAGVTLIDRVLPRDDLAALMNHCDAYASLHRAEGFGYTIAEAMLLGKPTVATAYSANLEFMSPQTAYAIPYRLVPVGDGHPPYPADAVWAEPDLDAAAATLQHIYTRRDEAREVGRQAKETLPALLSPQAAGERMLARLAAIRKLRSCRTPLPSS